jgi:chromate reductase
MTDTILGFSGSLRKGSYNTALLRVAAELMPASMTLEIFDLAPLPFYNSDLERLPESVRQFREKIASADGLLIASPEYDHSISGVLKNAIDWATLPMEASILRRKPVAIMGAAQGGFATMRGQLHLRQIFSYHDMLVVSKPEVLILHAQRKFNSQGKLLDKLSIRLVRQLLISLRELATPENSQWVRVT